MYDYLLHVTYLPLVTHPGLLRGILDIALVQHPCPCSADVLYRPVATMALGLSVIDAGLEVAT